MYEYTNRTVIGAITIRLFFPLDTQMHIGNFTCNNLLSYYDIEKNLALSLMTIIILKVH